MVNLLPLAEGETISTVLPLPEDEAEWGKLHVMFATAKGSRPAQLDGRLRQHPARTARSRCASRKDRDDRLIGVALLTEDDDVLLATRNGKAIRFAATDVREFQSRTSTGVRGIALNGDDEVISLSILRGFDADHRGARRLSQRRAVEGRRARDRRWRPSAWPNSQAAEEFILTVCANGYGKRSSAYEYRRTNRGGQGITNIDNLDRNGPVVASFPAHNGEQLMLVTDQAKLIRMSVGDTRVIGRNSAGVRLFNVAEDEHVVSRRADRGERGRAARTTRPSEDDRATEIGATAADDRSGVEVDRLPIRHHRLAQRRAVALRRIALEAEQGRRRLLGERDHLRGLGAGLGRLELRGVDALASRPCRPLRAASRPAGGVPSAFRWT